MDGNPIPRRAYLASVAGVLGTAGCLGERSGGESTPPPEPQGTEAIVPATKVSSLSTPVRGDPDADVTVSAYEDFACPHCREYTLSVLPDLVDEFVESGEIRYERYDFPIPVHEKWSWAAANAARAVQADAGTEAFWEYTDLLYENQENYSSGLLADLAREVDADAGAVETALQDDVYRPVVEDDRKRGRERGVTGTPTVFVNDRSVDSSLEEIRGAIESELGSSG